MTPVAPHPARPPLVRRRWLLPLLAALAPAVFALATNNIWEDFFITFRCSLNLAQGHGLVFEPGRVLHVFTSPLGVLLPAFIAWVLHSADAQLVLDVFRVASCTCLAVAAGLAAGGLASRLALAVAAGLWLLDPKLAAYSTNGMETALLVLFVIWAWRSLLAGEWRRAGLALGGALWTRPDGFVFVGTLMLALAAIDPAARRNGRAAVTVAGWGAVVYAPWLAWATWYYGSPVPQTIIAKLGVVGDAGSWSTLVTYPLRIFFGHTATDDAFLPAYSYFGGWPHGLWLWGKLLSLVAVVAAAWPRCERAARVAGLAFVLGGFYMEVTPRAPWYFPAWEVLAYLAAGGVVAALAEGVLLARTRLRGTVLAVAAGAVVLQAALFLAVSIQLREQQRVIEWGLRARLGRELGAAARSEHDTVFLEPLGYIGYFSGLAMRDTPGLCAPEVVKLRRAGIRGMGNLAVALRPDWVVLRASEYAAMDRTQLANFLRHYKFWSNYDVRDQVAAIPFLPGRDFLEFDAHFLVMRRARDDPPPETP